jgi:hypothetical protein
LIGLNFAAIGGYADCREFVMIRGAIEIANRSIVSGWLYSSAVDLRGQLVLAFVGKRHVGTGKIELFRKDIKDAGLGSGYSGFYFPVALEPGEEPEAVVVRLDQSDLALMHRDSVVVAGVKQSAGRTGA